MSPEHRGLVVAVCRLSCFSACGILVSRPGIRPASSTLQGRFLSSGPPGNPTFLLLLMSSKAVELQETHLAHLCILERVTPSFRRPDTGAGCISTPSPLLNSLVQDQACQQCAETLHLSSLLTKNSRRPWHLFMLVRPQRRCLAL